MTLALQLWSVIRSQGKTMPTGGTLLIGREQDCEGGCFDSAPGEQLAFMSPSCHLPDPSASLSRIKQPHVLSGGKAYTPIKQCNILLWCSRCSCGPMLSYMH